MHTEEELIQAIKTIDSLIMRCEKSQKKFQQGTSQYTLLKNRLKALYISKSLIKQDSQTFTQEEFEKALPPINSIIHKCTQAIQKHKEESVTYKRLKPSIDAMLIAKDYLEDH